VTEVIHSMLEDGPTTCERCGGELRRVLYPAGIIFKGSGFYRTDSRNGEAAKSATPGSKDTSSTAPSADAPAAPSKSEGSGTTKAEPSAS
jgi:predicted nucleic acid-binding Zn ribbon protein